LAAEADSVRRKQGLDYRPTAMLVSSGLRESYLLRPLGSG
jgi:hypothetical protein